MKFEDLFTDVPADVVDHDPPTMTLELLYEQWFIARAHEQWAVAPVPARAKSNAKGPG